MLSGLVNPNPNPTAGPGLQALALLLLSGLARPQEAQLLPKLAAHVAQQPDGGRQAAQQHASQLYTPSAMVGTWTCLRGCCPAPSRGSK